MSTEKQDTQKAKAAAGNAAASLVLPEMVIGLGTGSTANFFIKALSKRIQEGLNIKAVATSKATSQYASSLGIPLINIDDTAHVDLTIDGADEIDPQKQMIKGAGGALLCEKILASASKEMIVIIDLSKLVKSLGKVHLPVEIITYGYKMTLKHLNSLGVSSKLRISKGEPYITDMGNHIVDIMLPPTDSLAEINQKILAIPGVVDTGLFLNMAGRVIIGHDDGSVIIW